MRTILLALFALMLSSVVWGQVDGNITGKYYITNIDIPVKQNDITSKDTTSVVNYLHIAKAGTKFTAYEVKKGMLLVKFWKFNEQGKQKSQTESTLIYSNNGGYHYVSKETDSNYFLMEMEDFNGKVSPYNGYYNSFVWGFTTLPLKVRFKSKNRPFHYANSFSLGVNAGYEHGFRGRKEQAIGAIVGVGGSTVQIESTDVSENYELSSSTSGAFTLSAGVVYSYEQFQIGCFLGTDLIPGELGKHWLYQGKPWLGLGLGFTIFQKNKTKASSGGENKE